MTGRIQAMKVVVGFTVVSVMLSLSGYLAVPAIALRFLSALAIVFSCLSASAIALVALRHGVKQAMLPLAASVAVLVVASLAQNTMDYALNTLFLAALVVFAGAIRVLRSLPLTMIFSVILAAVGIVGFHVVVGDTDQWWLSMIKDVDTSAVQQADLENREQFYDAVATIAPFFTGVIAAVFVMQCLGCLFIARWWQAMLYNPGGFQKEFHELQLGKRFAIAALIILIPVIVDMGVVSDVAKDLVMVIAMLYLLQGLSVIHVLFKSKNLSSGLLYVLYGFLFIVSPVLFFFIMIQGYLETWVNLRGRFKLEKNGSSD